MEDCVECEEKKTDNHCLQNVIWKPIEGLSKGVKKNTGELICCIFEHV